MIYLQIIWEAIKANMIGVMIGLVGLMATITLFLPKNSRLYKILNFLSKK